MPRHIARATPDDEPPKTPMSALEATIRRKQRELEATIRDMGMEALDERLQSATAMPLRPAYRLATLIAENVPMGRAVLVYEVARPTPETTSAELAELAKAYVQVGGASALVVRTDSADTPSGLRDLFSVQQAVPKVPVLARDWLIHPLQVCEIKESGAAGALGLINQPSYAHLPSPPHPPRPAPRFPDYWGPIPLGSGTQPRPLPPGLV
eukprot:XP_001693769.1 indole-3-glycerol-phosphate synthase [Chlamydomonas reinhardtii]